MNASIVFACDDNYAGYTAVTIQSIIENITSDRKLDIYIFDSGISMKSRESIKKLESKNTSVSFIDIDKDLFKNFPLTIDYISIATYFRLKLPSVLPNISKVLYLDVDVLVNGDIFDLFDIDLNGKAVAAVADPLLNHETQHLHDIGLTSRDFGYFNAGVLLFDLTRLREIKFETQVEDFLTTYKDKLKFQDQDILNGVLGNDVLFIPPKYNLMPAHRLLLKSENENRLKLYPSAISDVQNAKKKGVVFHYCGKEKPWMYSCRHAGCRKFKHYQKSTEWSGREYTDIENLSLSKKISLYFKRLSRN